MGMQGIELAELLTDRVCHTTPNATPKVFLRRLRSMSEEKNHCLLLKQHTMDRLQHNCIWLMVTARNMYVKSIKHAPVAAHMVHLVKTHPVQSP